LFLLVNVNKQLASEISLLFDVNCIDSKVVKRLTGRATRGALLGVGWPGFGLRTSAEIPVAPQKKANPSCPAKKANPGCRQ
jgi:hypothetical protein